MHTSFPRLSRLLLSIFYCCIFYYCSKYILLLLQFYKQLAHTSKAASKLDVSKLGSLVGTLRQKMKSFSTLIDDEEHLHAIFADAKARLARKGEHAFSCSENVAHSLHCQCQDVIAAHTMHSLSDCRVVLCISRGGLWISWRRGNAWAVRLQLHRRSESRDVLGSRESIHSRKICALLQGLGASSVVHYAVPPGLAAHWLCKVSVLLYVCLWCACVFEHVLALCSVGHMLTEMMCYITASRNALELWRRQDTPSLNALTTRLQLSNRGISLRAPSTLMRRADLPSRWGCLHTWSVDSRYPVCRCPVSGLTDVFRSTCLYGSQGTM